MYLGKVNALEWWDRNDLIFPVLSVLARRYLTIRSNVACQEKLVKVLSVLHSKERRNMSPGLIDSVVFLYVNGILDSRVPEDLYHSTSI